MPIIHLETHINAPVNRVFDLARNIDLHQYSTKQTNEKAIAGRTSGLMELGETVTWRAKHFGVYQNLTVKLTKMEKPLFFEDEMLQGAFASMKHRHEFVATLNGTKMIDRFEFTSPLGILGRLANQLFLKNYMRKFLLIRNQELKDISEGQAWKE